MTETKALPLAEFKVLDEAEGIVETIVAVSGIEDKVKDIIAPGALGASLEKRMPVGVWSHDWDTPVSKALEIRELQPGDDGLPEIKADGQPWPSDAGGLYVKAQYNLGTQAGREAFSWAQFMGKDQQWSIGYSVPRGGSQVEEKTGIRHIKAIDVYEYSQVIHGAMPITRTLTVKSIKDHFESEEEKLEPELAAELKVLMADLLAEDESAEEVEAIIDEKTAAPTEEDVDVDADVDVEVEAPEETKSVDAELAEALATAMGEEGESLDVKGVIERALALRKGVKYVDTIEVSEDGVSETKVYTFVEDSWEMIEHKVRTALRMSRKEVFGEDAGYPHVVATFGEKVIVEIFSDGDDQWFELSYSMGESGVEFGEPSEVRLATAVTAKSEWNDILWELKEGRAAQVESATQLQSSVDLLMKLLAAAGVEIEGKTVESTTEEADEAPEEIDDETKDEDDGSVVISLKDLSPEERAYLLGRIPVDDD
jgi:phage head maturation protease